MSGKVKKSPSRAERTGPLDMSPDALRRWAQDAVRDITRLRKSVRGWITMTPDARQASIGKLREGEPEVMIGIFDAVDAHPQHFASLAAKDRGEDDQVVETGPSRDDLARREALGPLAIALVEFGQEVGDTMMRAAEGARSFSIASYELGRVNATHDAKLRDALGAAMSYYGAPARKAARSRKKAAKADK